MVSMLDERDKLMDSLREAQERLNDAEIKLSETEKERDSLQRQINANLPQVCMPNQFHSLNSCFHPKHQRWQMTLYIGWGKGGENVYDSVCSSHNWLSEWNQTKAKVNFHVYRFVSIHQEPLQKKTQFVHDKYFVANWIAQNTLEWNYY